MKPKPLDLARTRIFGVAAHIDAGKTTVSERMLFVSGEQYRPGLVDEGTATMDFEEEERERGITIHSAAIQLGWQDEDLTLVDTPGHVDFTVEVERCMRILDGVVIVFDSSQGVEAQSETVWRQAVEHDVARLAFLNKLDKVGADWDMSVQSLRDRLSAVPVSLQVPWVTAEGEIRLVDLVSRRVVRYEGNRADAGQETSDWNPGQSEGWESERLALVESIASHDEQLLELFVEDEDVSAGDLRAAIRRLTLAGTVLPVLGGAALRGIGVEPLLDAVRDYLPSPLDVSRPKARHGTNPGLREVELDPEAPLAAQIFKVVATRHGPISWVRIHQGTLEAGMQVRNPRRGKVERARSLFVIQADDQKAIDRARAGQILGVKGLKTVRTGDSLCHPKELIEFPGWDFPLPVISMAVEARRVEDRDRLIECFGLLRTEDPTMDWRINEDTGQLLISGMGELHLQILANRLKRDFRLDVNLGSPRVAYRESLGRPERLARVFERRLPNREVSVYLDVSFEPCPEADLPIVEARLTSPESPQGRLLIETAIASLKSELSAGPAHGFPMTQVKALVLGLGQAQMLPSPDELEIGLSALVRELGRIGDLLILEPWMTIEIHLPEAHLSSVLGDIQANGGEIRNVEVKGESAALVATAALSKMLDFSTRLRSLTQGRGSHEMRLSRYRELSKEARQRLLAE
ncbi:MAG: elongation factor G [Planctomycetota bacterium]